MPCFSIFILAQISSDCNICPLISAKSDININHMCKITNRHYIRSPTRKQSSGYSAEQCQVSEGQSPSSALYLTKIITVQIARTLTVAGTHALRYLPQLIG